MKKIISLALFSLFVFSISACNSGDKKYNEPNAKVNPKDPVPKTITKQEVARIAIIEAKQFLTNTTEFNKNLDVTKAQNIYNQAQIKYDNGQFKEAQKLAVDVRHVVQELITK